MTDAEAVHTLAAATVGDGNAYRAVRLHRGADADPELWAPGESEATMWANGTHSARLARWLERFREDAEPALFLAPYVDRGSFRLPGASSCLWVRAETRESVARLGEFRPNPTLTLGYGSAARRDAIWALTRPLSPEDTERANKRLAHALKAKKKWAPPGAMAVSPPGTVLWVGRKRRAQVRVVGGSLEAYAPAAVVKRLADAPDPSAWKCKV